jgi:hypothetical protein
LLTSSKIGPTTAVAQAPPNYSNLASTVNLNTPAAGATGTLCSGANIIPGATQVGAAYQPINTGAYNYNKVALSGTSQVYEVTCYGGTEQDSSCYPQTGTFGSIESCMAVCNQYASTNIPSSSPAGPCVLAYFIQMGVGNANNANTCKICTNAQAGYTPHKLIGGGVRTAKLLTGNPGTVIDTNYLMQFGSGTGGFSSSLTGDVQDLNLCGGAANNWASSYYDRTYVSPFNKGVGSASGGPYLQGGSRNDGFFITCLGYSYYQGATAQPTIASSSLANTGYTQFGLGATQAPTTADDCARLCNWLSASTTYKTDGTGCLLFEWVSLGTNPQTYQCNLYGKSYNPGNVQPTNQSSRNVVVAGLSKAGGTSDMTNAGTGLQQYKKRSVPPGAPPNRSHPRDALADGDHTKADVIIPWPAWEGVSWWTGETVAQVWPRATQMCSVTASHSSGVEGELNRMFCGGRDVTSFRSSVLMRQVVA